MGGAFPSFRLFPAPSWVACTLRGEPQGRAGAAPGERPGAAQGARGASQAGPAAGRVRRERSAACGDGGGSAGRRANMAAGWGWFGPRPEGPSLSSDAECLMCLFPQKGPVPVGLALQAQRAHGEYLPQTLPRSGSRSAARGAHGGKGKEIPTALRHHFQNAACVNAALLGDGSAGSPHSLCGSIQSPPGCAPL